MGVTHNKLDVGVGVDDVCVGVDVGVAVGVGIRIGERVVVCTYSVKKIYNAVHTRSLRLPLTVEHIGVAGPCPASDDNPEAV